MKGLYIPAGLESYTNLPYTTTNLWAKAGVPTAELSRMSAALDRQYHSQR